MNAASFCPEPRPDLRSRVLSAATALFYQRGCLAVSVNDIAEAAGATKTSLYRYFPSKDALAVACLEADILAEQTVLEELARHYASDPIEHLRAVVAEVADRMVEPEVRGWMPANFAVEIADPDHPIRRACKHADEMLRRHVLELVRKARLENPEAITDSLLLAMLGAAIASQINKKGGAAAALKASCEALISRQQLNVQAAQ